MVSWWDDGDLSGYNSQFEQSMLGQYHLATNGVMVDVNGVTRLQYSYPASESDVNKDRITVRARIRISAADITNNHAKVFTATMFMAPASAFAPGVIPTIDQMLALGSSLLVSRSTGIATTAGDKTFTIRSVPSSALTPNTKYWVLVLPVAIASTALTPNTTNDKVPNGNTNSIGRGVSMWTNRTPGKPVITSPQSGSLLAPEAVVTLSYTGGDPDAMGGYAPSARNKDIAGVQVQYARRPTPSNPNPDWQGIGTYLNPVDDPSLTSGWYILGSTDSNNSVDLAPLRDNQSIQLRCGEDGSPNHSEASIPAGDWQIRMRTFDFGHPDPAYYNPLMNESGTYSADTYPALNTSPWSDAVLVSIPTRLPPPLLLGPIDSIAIAENIPVTLRYQYRNTAVPPLAQAYRVVQIRPVGSSDWTTVARGATSSTSVDLSVWGPLGAVDRLWDWEDSLDGLDGWGFMNTPAGGDALTRDTTQHHSGTACMKVIQTTDNEAEIDISAYVTPGSLAAVELWAKALAVNTFHWAVKFYDGDDVMITHVADANGLVTTDWQQFTGTFDVPDDAVTTILSVFPDSGVAVYVDDVSIGTPTPYELEATTKYEWRVSTGDSESDPTDPTTMSNYSEIGRFWIVPAPASGEVLPTPADTIEGATIGCGTHRAFIYRRGGLTRVAEIKGFSYLDWGRVRDDISTAKVVVSDWDIDCGNLLANLKTWAYELVIYRDNGSSVDRVWEGPLTLLTYEVDKVTLNAKDVMGYAYRRIIRQAMNDTGTGNGDTVINRAKRILQNVFAPDDPNLLAYLQIVVSDDDPMEYRSTPAYSRTAFEEIDDMASNAGLDYTTVGRSIVLWSTRHRTGLLPEFTDKDFGNSPIVSEYGMSMANRYAVSDGNGLYGEATRLNSDGEDPTYGLVEMLSSSWASDSSEDFDTYTEAAAQKIRDSFKEFAERSIGDRYPPPVVVRIPDNTTLNPDAVISIQQLVPGVVIPLRSVSTLRTVVGSQKLDSVKVVEQSPQGEVISITVSPFNRDDASFEDTGGDE